MILAMRNRMMARLSVMTLLAALAPVSAARADDRVECQRGSSIASRLVRPDPHFPVRVAVTPPGAAPVTITAAAQLPSGVKCAAGGAVTFLADASTDGGKSYHRVMSRTRAQADGTWLVDVAPDSFNGNFAYTAQFGIMVIPGR
jgi:hypothetical protein